MPLPSDHAAKLDQSDRQARQNAIARIGKLTRLASAIHEMIEEEQRLIASPIPYADNAHMRANAALHRAAYAVFECDDLRHLACDLDPDWCQPVPLTAGICKGAVA